jgi:hypothetical protein
MWLMTNSSSLSDDMASRIIIFSSSSCAFVVAVVGGMEGVEGALADGMAVAT